MMLTYYFGLGFRPQCIEQIHSDSAGTCILVPVPVNLE